MKSAAEKFDPEMISDDEELLGLMLREEGWSTSPENRIVPRTPGLKHLPLSFAQERLWFLDRLDPGNPSYNVAFRLQLRGRLDVEALEKSFRQLVLRHESLRSRFVAVGGAPKVYVDPQPTFSLRLVEHTQFSPEDGALALQRLCGEEATRPFDLSLGPLLRATLVRLEPFRHVLLITIHHIVCDGWSIGVLTRELGALYAGYARGVPAALAPLTIQYSDFAAWQRQWLQGARFAGLVEYWKQVLADPPLPVELPFDRPRSASPARRGQSVAFEVGESTLQQLGTVFSRGGASLHAGLSAAFAVLLQRYSGQNDIVIGSPYANRSFQEVEPLVGFFVNTIPLRISVSGNPTFVDLLETVRRRAEEAFAHQDLPFEAMVGALQPDRNLGQNPIFQVLFALQNAPIQPLALADLEADVEMDQQTCRFDLELHAWEEQGRLRGKFSYPSELFDAPTIERMRELWLQLLDGIAARPDGRVSELCRLSNEEHDLTLGWSTGPDIGDPGVRLHELWSRQVRATPDRIALRADDEQWTYRSFDTVVNRIAANLRKRGVRPDATVGICCERSAWMWASVLAVLKVGAAYVPVDADYPPARCAFIAREAGFSVLLTQRSLADRLPDYHGERICADEVGRASVPGIAETESRSVPRNSLFCVLYTSGSTGVPKGVCLTHGIVEDTVRRYADGPSRQALQFAPLGFDVSLEEAFPAWCTGGTLTVVSGETRRDVPALARLLAEQRTERAIFPVTLLQRLAELPAEAQAYALVDVVATGEQLQVSDVMRQWFARLPSCTLRNVYGPTEAQVITDYVLPENPRDWPALPPIGRPLPNFSGYVLGADLELLPRGVLGELWARNETASRGYMGQPGRTAERFFPSPFGPAGSRMYRTGDIVRWLSDGTLEFHGRRDGQVKIRGLRVETGEIEARLLRHPLVRDAIVLPRKDASGSIQLVAAVTWHKRAPSAEELRAHLRISLPDYMIPATVFVCERFPLNANGKVDRPLVLAEALRETEATRRADLAPLQTPMEHIVADAWRTVLGLKEVGRNAHFFAVGGHSLNATQVASRLKEQLETEIPVQLFFEFPRLAELASALESLAAARRDEQGASNVEPGREEFVL